MNPLELRLLESIVMNDPWWLSLVKAVLIFALLLVLTIFNVWYERRVVGKMQHRLGPIMNGPLGLGQALADGSKLIFKEDFRPAGTDRVVFNLAPVFTGVAAFTSWAVIPLGGEVTMFGHRTRLQLIDLPVGVLFVLAIASVGIYGVVLAGWASNSTYSLLGALRSSAQMISYEVAMGLSLVAVFLFAGSMSTAQIVDAQAVTWQPFGLNTHLPGWYAALLIPSFIIYCISMVGETNRAPFDLPECESELVSGYLTDYSGFRYAMYFLAEYINMATVSAVATTLFMGGYRAPWPFNLVGWLDSGWMGPVWFLAKVLLFIFGFIWLRGTLPRFRYDQFMHLGWKWLIPLSLFWLVAVATLKSAQTLGWIHSTAFLVLVGVVLAALLALLFFGGKREPEPVLARARRFDAFEFGYPVPPMGDQTLPELADIVAGASSPEPATAAASSSSGSSVASPTNEADH